MDHPSVSKLAQRFFKTANFSSVLQISLLKLSGSKGDLGKRSNGLTFFLKVSSSSTTSLAYFLGCSFLGCSFFFCYYFFFGCSFFCYLAYLGFFSSAFYWWAAWGPVNSGTNSCWQSQTLPKWSTNCFKFETY